MNVVPLLIRLAADTLLLAHGAFILFVAFGALLVWRWPRLAWLHVPSAAWGVFIEFSGAICPLTPWENTLRRMAGEAGYSGGFIDHYLWPLIYPTGLTPEHQWLLGAGVLLLNAILYIGLIMRRWRAIGRRNQGE